MTQIADGGEIIKENKPVRLEKPAIILLVLASVLVLAVGIGISFAVFYPRKNNSVVIENDNRVIETKPKPVSKLATDSAFLQLKSDLDGFISELDRIDLIEPQLAPPNIDLNINVQIK